MSRNKEAYCSSFPAIVFDHVSEFDDEFAFFVLLAALKRVLLGDKAQLSPSVPFLFTPPPTPPRLNDRFV